MVVVGAGVVFAGWWTDRDRYRTAMAEAANPPRPLPGLSEDATPEYIHRADLQATTPPRPDSSADEGAMTTTVVRHAPDLDAILAHRDDAATVPAGVPQGFINIPEQQLAALLAPAVLAINADLTGDREVNAVLLAAARRDRPVVILARRFSPAVLGTLHANAATGKLPNLPIELADAKDLRRAVALTGGRVVDADDLASGWLPEAAWGTCDGWVADADDSWIVVSGRP